MGSYYCMGSNSQPSEDGGVNEGQKRPITNSGGDSFVVDVPRLSQLTDKDIVNAGNSRFITRKLSKKGSYNERQAIPTLTAAPSPTEKNVATLHGVSTPEKPGIVAVGSTESSVNLQVHHHITINNASESKRVGKRLSSRRFPSVWSIDPRRIFLFFATLSSMGTIVLIYFTLTIGKLNRSDNDMN